MSTNIPNETPLPSIPDHEVLRCIGRGSFGLVWLARNRMGTYRAVKVVSRRAFDNPKPYEREVAGVRRFEPVSRSHEGFVDILHVGINDTDGYFYYIMELGDDESRGQEIEPTSYSPKTLAGEISHRGRLFLQECVQLGLGLSGGLAELHDRGLVHRDIKPANIIFVNGVPKLADAGLVADVKDAPTYAGTKGFIPPEGPGTAQADIYSLGKVLYEAATGKDREEFPELPPLPADPLETKRLLDLNEILIEACQNDIKRRYRSAWDLHSDLQMIADNVSLREVKTLRRRLARLKRIALAAALVVLGVGSVGYTIYRDVRNHIDTRRREINSNILKGNRALDLGDLGGAFPYFVEALKREDGTDAGLADRLRLGSAWALSPRLTHCWHPAMQINDAEFSPDGSKVVISGFTANTKIYDLLTGKLHGFFGSSTGVFSAAYSLDGQAIVTSSQDRSCITWDAATLAERKHWFLPGALFNGRFNSDRTRIVVAGADGFARILNADTGQPELELKHASVVRFADFSHNGKMVVTASQDGSAQVWDAKTGDPLGAPFIHERSGAWVYFAAFSPDDKRVATASSDRTARIWEVNGRQVPPDLFQRQPVDSVEFSPDGRYILTASLDGTARLWRSRDLRPVPGNSVFNHGDPLSRASFSPDGCCVVTASLLGSIRMWDLAGNTLRPMATSNIFNQQGTRSLRISTNGNIQVSDALSETLLSDCTNPGNGFVLKKAEFSRNGSYILGTLMTASNLPGPHALLQVWEAAHGRTIGPGIRFSEEPTGAALSENGQRLAVFAGREVQVWDITSGTSLSPLLIQPETVTLATFSPDAKRLAVANGNAALLVNAVSGQQIGDTMNHPVPVSYMDFSPDGAWLATCCQDYLLTKCCCQIWNGVTAKAERQRLWHTDGVLYAAFSADSRRVVTGGEDSVAMIWDRATGAQIGSSLEHSEDVRMASFSPNGKWIVTASADRTARVWDAGTGYPLTPPLPHLTRLTSARFLADGRRIVTSDALGHRWIWTLPVDDRSLEDLIRIARLMSGDAGRPVPPTSQSSETLEVVWNNLHLKGPSEFSTSQAEVGSWHESQAKESEAEQDWFAAAFHLRLMLKLHPGDSNLLQRLSNAEALRAPQDVVRTDQKQPSVHP